MDLGCHIINLFRWYFGEISSIKSYLGYRYDLEIEDHATCIAKFESGPIGIINVGWFSQESQKKVELFGTVQHAVENRIPESKVLAAIRLLTTNSTQYESTYLRELQHFVYSVRRDFPPSPSGNDALKDLEAISQAYQNEISLK
jgi:predicted dehydrogenase